MDSIIEPYKLFTGNIERNMPLLVSGRDPERKEIDVPRTPMTLQDFMKLYVEISNQPKFLGPDYTKAFEMLDNLSLTLGDGLAHHSDGRIKIVPDAQYIKELSLDMPKKHLNSDYTAVNLSNKFDSLEGQVFSREEVGKYCNMDYYKTGVSKQTILENPIWVALAGGDKKLLEEFVEIQLERPKREERKVTTLNIEIRRNAPKVKAEGLIFTLHTKLENGYMAVIGSGLDNFWPYMIGVARVRSFSPRMEESYF